MHRKTVSAILVLMLALSMTLLVSAAVGAALRRPNGDSISDPRPKTLGDPITDPRPRCLGDPITDPRPRLCMADPIDDPRPS